MFADYSWYKYKGEKGDPAPNTIYQYSVNNIDWTDVATGAQWYRQSGDNGTTWSEAIAIGITAYVDGKISQTITEDVEDKAPSEGAVFDALALKADASDVAEALLRQNLNTNYLFDQLEKGGII